MLLNLKYTHIISLKFKFTRISLVNMEKYQIKMVSFLENKIQQLHKSIFPNPQAITTFPTLRNIQKLLKIESCEFTRTPIGKTLHSVKKKIFVTNIIQIFVNCNTKLPIEILKKIRILPISFLRYIFFIDCEVRRLNCNATPKEKKNPDTP